MMRFRSRMTAATGAPRLRRHPALTFSRSAVMDALLGVMRTLRPVLDCADGYCLIVSGKEAVLPSPPPLRTARDSFPSSSSSLSNAQGRTRFRYIQPSAMDLSMAVRVEEYTVVRPI